MATTATRRCPVCKRNKPHGQFYLRKGKPAGYCKTCTKIQAKKWQHQKREKVVGIEEAHRLRERRRHFDELSKRDSKLSDKRTCRCCEKVFPLGEFYVVSGKPDSYCKKCRLIIDKKLNSKSPAARMKSLLSAARTRARNNRQDFDLTKEFLLDLWRLQQGRCHYVGTELTYDGNRPSSALSIDRIDSSGGYTQDNVVLCCRRVNEMKSNLTVEEFVELCHLVVEINEKRSVARG